MRCLALKCVDSRLDSHFPRFDQEIKKAPSRGLFYAGGGMSCPPSVNEFRGPKEKLSCRKVFEITRSSRHRCSSGPTWPGQASVSKLSCRKVSGAVRARLGIDALRAIARECAKRRPQKRANPGRPGFGGGVVGSN